ncbi:hypothetical protein [Chryseolinea sp. H1M3-3]|uniref:hypothetical protein n=1 Tax=Chryseolinea sp. H1M3-3 TaxID=3034144 RepID=UPI0023ECB370|nr:hypothetical protein [Chryseolinea sp. H1M3-3]
MKKSVVIFGLMMVSTIIFAQHKSDAMERAARQADKMKTELSLDDVQHKAIRAINEDFASGLSKVKNDSAISREAKQTKMKALHQEREEAVKKVLTDEQEAKWATHRSEHAKKRKGSMAKHTGEHAQRMQKNLSLSDDQASKIKAIDKEFAEKFRALRNESETARDVTREKAKQLREEYISKTKSVLTEEQFKKWEEQKAERKRRRL